MKKPSRLVSVIDIILAHINFGIVPQFPLKVEQSGMALSSPKSDMVFAFIPLYIPSCSEKRNLLSKSTGTRMCCVLYRFSLSNQSLLAVR